MAGAGGSLSSVVSDLVRAQMGASVPSNVTDEDLDRHVAELILKEAKKKAEQYGTQGIRAYLPQPESNVPKTNKRFLSSIIRNTDDHNKSILRAQALSASEIRMEREAQLRAERKARAEEAAAAERTRRSRRGRDHSRDRGRKRSERSWERYGSDEDEDRWSSSKRRRDDGDEARRRHHHRSRSAGRPWGDEDEGSKLHRHRSRTPDLGGDDIEEPRRQRRHASRSRSPRRSDERKPRRAGETTSKRRRSLSPSDAKDGDRRSRRRRRRNSRSPGPDSASEVDDDSRRRRRSHHHDSSRRHRHRSRPRSQDKVSRSDTLSQDFDPSRQASGSRAPSQPPSPAETSRDLSLRESDLRRKLKGKGKATEESAPKRARSRSRTPASNARAASPAPTRPPSPGPRPPPGPPPPLPPPDDFTRDSIRPDLPSKMDKYFEASYDPRLDVAPLPAPNIPATGLIDNDEFEGWDAMLDLIKQRREDKAERKRLERLGVPDKSSKDKKKSKSKVAGLGVAGTLASWSEGTSSMMGIEYKKRGSVREWDLGKEEPT